MNFLTKYSKFIVALLSALGVGLETAYPGTKYTELFTTVAGALLVYFVPNSGGGNDNTGSAKPTG